MIYFTADHHFGHKNIIEYCNRPFESVEEMDNILIAKWNSKISSVDTVYHLGDFCFGNITKVKSYLSKLNGYISILTSQYLHDSNWFGKNVELKSKTGQHVRIIPHYFEIKINSIPIIMFHFPIEEWNKKHYGSIHFHGHSHGNSRKEKNRFDVGVDVWDFYPVTVEEILEKGE